MAAGLQHGRNYKLHVCCCGSLAAAVRKQGAMLGFADKSVGDVMFRALDLVKTQRL